VTEYSEIKEGYVPFDGVTISADRKGLCLAVGGEECLRPIQDVILVRPTVVQDTTQGGIVIPQKSILKTCEGTVLAVGPGARSAKGHMTPTELLPGDYVLFEASHGVRMNYRGERLLVMREPDVIGVLDGPQGNVYDPTPYYELPEVRV
jgi:chaperonin GroES